MDYFRSKKFDESVIPIIDRCEILTYKKGLGGEHHYLETEETHICSLWKESFCGKCGNFTYYISSKK